MPMRQGLFFLPLENDILKDLMTRLMSNKLVVGRLISLNSLVEDLTKTSTS